MMTDILIVPLSAPAWMSAHALSVLQNANKLFLQTVRHPFAVNVTALDKPFESMDALYDGAENFDALNSAIAARLTNAAPCVYAVTGRIADTQLPAIQKAAERAGLTVGVLPGLPQHAAAFPDKASACVFTASALPAYLNPALSMAVEEIDSALAAGETKLLMMEYYPDDWDILIADADEQGAYASRTIPLYELDRQAGYTALTCVYAPPVPFDQLARTGYFELMDVMRRLRAPSGCPWDREQTHESLKPTLLEECYELLDAIDEGDDAHIMEEIGDVLLQVVFHCVIAEEQGRFTDRDVITGLVDKLVYRHPHIFGSVKADTAEKVLENWDKLKKVEKDQKTQTDVLKSVPRNLPALTRSRKVQKKAANVGFDWDSAELAFPKIVEETDELRAAMNGEGNVAEEMGDLLFALVNVARLLKLDPEFLLLDATDKFIRRFAAMEQKAADDGHALEDMTLEDMDVYWEMAKKSEFGELFTK